MIKINAKSSFFVNILLKLNSRNEVWYKHVRGLLSNQRFLLEFFRGVISRNCGVRNVCEVPKMLTRVQLCFTRSVVTIPVKSQVKRLLCKTPIIYILVVLLISSCSKYIISPARVNLPKEGSYPFLKGIRDGCDTAHSSRGNSLYRTFFDLSYTLELVENDEYFDAWLRGYIYCFKLVNKYAFGSIDDYLEPEHNWFWNKGDWGSNPKIVWPFAMPEGGVDINFGGKITLPGEGENWWNGMFSGCKGVFQCQ